MQSKLSKFNWESLPFGRFLIYLLILLGLVHNLRHTATHQVISATPAYQLQVSDSKTYLLISSDDHCVVCRIWQNGFQPPSHSISKLKPHLKVDAVPRQFAEQPQFSLQFWYQWPFPNGPPHLSSSLV